MPEIRNGPVGKIILESFISDSGALERGSMLSSTTTCQRVVVDSSTCIHLIRMSSGPLCWRRLMLSVLCICIRGG